MSEPSVEREQAVGDALEVVHLLDVRARRLADPAALGRIGDEGLEALRAGSPCVALTIGTRVAERLPRCARPPPRAGR